ncbi:MAG: histidine--tRNA ligase [Gemmatimonadota bacterium]
MQAKALPGFRDFYPEDFALRSHIFETWRRVAGRYGFEEYDGPPLESLDLYTAKSGDEIVGQLYNFVDKGDRAVALRPEMTPSLARMVAARANGLKKPIRWFSIPQLFRYERQQRGRLREHFQLNCDLIGEAGPAADAEIIALAIDTLRGLGLTEENFKVRIGDRAILDWFFLVDGFTNEQRGAALQVIDKLERTPPEASLSRLSAAGLSVQQTALVFELVEVRSRKSLEALSAKAGSYPDGRAKAPAAEFLRTLDALDSMGLGGFVEVDFGIVRGLAYYTGIVFELFDAGKTLRAICGGGRYDNLVGAIGGVDLPCVGFGMGDVVLGELLKDRGLIPPHRPSIDVFLAAIGDDDQPILLRLAHDLRNAGIRVEYSLGSGAVGKQLKLADARNARLAVVIGPDDRAKGEVQVKDLVAKTQVAVPLSDLVLNVKSIVGLKD